MAALGGAAAAEPRDLALAKSAALVLLNRSLYYTVGKPGSDATLRLSAGLSLTIGPALAQRYVVTLRRGTSHTTIEQGGEPRLEEQAQAAVLTTLPKGLEPDLVTLAQGVLEACELFRAREEVTAALSVIGRKRRAELVGLEQLYARRRGSQQRLYGFPEPGTEGSTAIEAELRRLQRIVLDRYAVSVRVRILSLGVIARD